jgi:K+-sensing histidine kinase KdpD
MIDIVDGFPALLVHGERFRQMLRLLFIESLTHLQPGDQIQIQARVQADHAGQEYAVITLTDDGAWGGPQDSGENLFDPFYTRSRKPDDFGVNMMACYVNMHLHGGTVSARRLEPCGLELTMRLPLDPDQNCQEAETYLRGTLAGDAKWSGPLDLAA